MASNTNPPPKISCIGAANLDRHARAKHAVVLGTSNPVTITTAPGGVARNVAESLARLGCSVGLVSRIGADGEGDRVIARMTDLGVDMAGVTRSRDCATAGYTALIGPDGEMAVAMADMAIHDELTPDVLTAALAPVRDAAFWFADCNLPAESLALLRRDKPSATVLAIDTVSIAKAERLGGDLTGVDIVFCNRDEAVVLAGRTGSGVETVVQAVHQRGASSVVVSLGADGALVSDDDGCRRCEAYPTNIRDVTGAGDAMVAGTLFGLSRGRSLDDAVRLGLAAAAFALESDAAVNPALSADALLARAGGLA